MGQKKLIREIHEKVLTMEPRLSEVRLQLDELNHRVLGNGHPGLLQRVERLETSGGLLSSIFVWVVAPGSVLSLIAYFLLRGL